MRRLSGRVLLFRVLVLIVIGALFAYVYYLRSNPTVPDKVETRLPVVVSKAVRSTVEQTLVIGSYVESEQIVTVTPKASGTITSLTVDVGDRVAENQIIAQIDPEPYQIAENQAESLLEAARGTFERTEKLHEAGSASDATFEQVRSQFESATAGLDVATLNLKNTAVRSPVNGLVMARHRSAGEVVTAGVPIVTVSNTSDLLVSAEIPETYARYFVGGASPLAVRATIPSLPGTRFDSRVRFVSPYIRPETRTLRAACEISGDTRYVIPGMYVELEFVLDERSGVLTLPFDTLVGGDTLWFVDAAGSTAHSVMLPPAFANDEFFVVPEEFADTSFVVDGQHFLSEGIGVRIIEP